MRSIEQTPTELLDYTIDWTKRGLPTGATIVSQTVVVNDASVTISNQAIITNSTQTQFFVTGGVAGNVYQITTEITLSTTQKLDFTVNYICISSRSL